MNITTGGSRDADGIIVANPNPVEQDEMVESANKLLQKFLSLGTDIILDNYTDLEIRSVAILVGFPFTELSPSEMKYEHVEKIKAELRRKA